MGKSLLLLVQRVSLEAVAVRAALDESFRVEAISTCSEAIERLERCLGHGPQPSGPIGAILVDLDLPDSQGLDTFDRLYRAAPQIPMLILCSRQFEDAAKDAVRRGAQDYLLKGKFDEYLLPKALRSMVEQAVYANALFEEKERAQVTLNSIGDAVLSADNSGNVTYLNAVAEKLTGWPLEEAVGHSLGEVFRIIDGATRAIVPNPMTLAILENKTVGLTPNCMMIRRDGIEFAIEDSAAPIHDRVGQVVGAVIVFRDVSAARALSQEMIHLAQHDGLTGLPNRVLFSDRLTEAIAMAKRHGRRLAVLFVDIDRFKNVNDSLGHIIGDRILKSVSTRLANCVRDSDTVCRQGGDEFVILLSEIARPIDAAGSAEKVLRALEIPQQIDGFDVRISASIGIATFPEDGKNAKELIGSADFAMYHAKENGRNNYQFFKLEMHNRAAERRSTENGLRDALREDQLELYYQPEVRLDTGAITSVEALIRWHHPKRGMVLPGEFISTAAESGLIVPIGRWAIAEACRQARSWMDMGFLPIRIAVNISAVELRAKDFVTDVRDIIKEAGMSPDALELELTEASMMQDPRSTALVLGALKDLGVMLALDDFGTGYSSLSYLQRFPIDTLKIDRSLMCDVSFDASSATIVNAVIGMGQSMQKRVVAEGVETKEQVGFLQQRGCPEGQGFYYTPPRSAELITRFLRRNARAQNRFADQRSYEVARR